MKKTQTTWVKPWPIFRSVVAGPVGQTILSPGPNRDAEDPLKKKTRDAEERFEWRRSKWSMAGMGADLATACIGPGLTISFSDEIPVFSGNEISFRNFGKFRWISDEIC